MKKKVVKKAVKRKVKVKLLPPARIEVLAGPQLVEGSKLLREYTKHPTKAAIDASYAFLFGRGAIMKGSPVLEHFKGVLTTERKLEKIRSILDKDGLILEGFRC